VAPRTGTVQRREDPEGPKAALWRVGQRVKATVVGRLPDGRYLLRSPDDLWTAVSERTLEGGQEILGRVVRTEPVPCLRLLAVQGKGSVGTGCEKSEQRRQVFLDDEAAEAALAWEKLTPVDPEVVETYRMALILRSQALGLLGLGFCFQGDRLFLHMRCQTALLAQFLRGAAEELEEALARNGMHPVAVRVEPWDAVPSSVMQFLSQVPWQDDIDWVT